MIFIITQRYLRITGIRPTSFRFTFACFPVSSLYISPQNSTAPPSNTQARIFERVQRDTMSEADIGTVAIKAARVIQWQLASFYSKGPKSAPIVPFTNESLQDQAVLPFHASFSVICTSEAAASERGRM